MLNQELLEKTEEFLDLISNEEENDELTNAIESLREFLMKDVDGFTTHSGVELCEAVQSRLEEIWALISKDELSQNCDLEDYFDDLMATVESELSICESEEVDDDEAYVRGCGDYEENDDYERGSGHYEDDDENDFEYQQDRYDMEESDEEEDEQW